MLIHIYNSQLSKSPAQTIEYSYGSFEDYLHNNVKSYHASKKNRICVLLDGATIDQSQWYNLKGNIEIHVYPLAKGGAVALLIGAVLVSLVVQRLLAPSVKLPGVRETPVGQRLESSDVKANLPRLNQVIPEIAGRYKVYFDYLQPPIKRFVNKQNQNFIALFSVGVGDFDILLNDIKIGETPLSALTDNTVTISVFDSNTNVTNSPVPFGDIWYVSKEVSATSSSAGLELTSPEASSSGWGDTWFAFAEVPEYPRRIRSLNGKPVPFAVWQVGDVLRIIALKSIAVIDSSPRSTFVIDSELQPFVGMIVELVGDFDGIYKVHDVLFGGTQITLSYLDDFPYKIPHGTYRLGIGYAGLRYELENIGVFSRTINVYRLTDTGVRDVTWGGFQPLNISNVSIFVASSTSQHDFLGAFYTCPENEVTQIVQLDFFFPNGLCEINQESGAVDSHVVQVIVQYRDTVGTVPWTEIIYTYNEETLNQIGFTEQITLPYAMRAEIKVKRLGFRSTKTNVQDTVVWYGLRSFLYTQTAYPGITKIGIKIDNLSRLGIGAENQISAVVTRKLNGVATRKITPWINYLVSQFNSIPLDTAEFNRLQAIWDARNDTYDYAEIGESTLKTQINQALMCGYSELSIKKGLLTPVRDEVRTIYEQMYSNQNLIAPISKSFTAVKSDEIDGVEVEFMNQNNWIVETVNCRLAGDLGIKAKKIRLNGVIDKTKAWRIGMRVRRIEKYRRWSYKFSTELDGLNSQYMSYCVLADDVPTFSQSSQIDKVEHLGNNLYELTLLDPYDYAYQSPVLRFRYSNGRVSPSYNFTTTPDKFKIRATIVGTPPSSDRTQELPHIIFGNSNRLFYPVLISKISPKGFESVELDAVNYDVRVYADDDNSPA